MEQLRPAYLEQITLEDWEKTRFLCQKTGRVHGAASREFRKTANGRVSGSTAFIRKGQSDIEELIITSVG